MAGEDVIIQRVEIDGAKDLEAQLNALGKTGKEAFDSIGAAAAQATPKIGAIDAAAKRLGISYEEQAAKVKAASDAVRGTATAATEAGAAAKVASTGFTALGNSSDQAGRSMNASSVEAVRFGQIMRLLGRATGERELSHLGRTVGILGRAFTVAAPAIFIVALEKLAAAAAASATAVGDLAAKLALPIDQFQALSSVGVGVGQSLADAGKDVEALQKLFAQSATSQDHSAASLAKLQEQLAQTRDKTDDLVGGYSKLNEVLAKAQQKFNNTKIDTSSKDGTKNLIAAQQELADAQKHAREESLKLDLAISEGDKKQRDLARTIQLTNIEALKNGDALAKLGISAQQAADAAKNLNGAFSLGALEDLANRLAGITDPVQKARIEAQLLAAGLSGPLVRALGQGGEAIATFARLGEAIAPAFTKAQVAIGQDFVAASGRFQQSISSLKDQVGLKFAPGFITFFDDLTAAIVRNRSNFVELAAVIAKLPIASLGDQLGTVIDGFGVLARAVSFVTDKFNELNGLLGRLTGIADFNLAKPFTDALNPIGKAIESVKNLFKLFDDGKQSKDALNKSLSQDPSLGTSTLRSPEQDRILPKLEQQNAQVRALGKAWDFVKDGFNSVVALFNAFSLDKLVETFNRGVQRIAGFFVNLLPAGVFDTIVAAAQSLWDQVTGIWNAGVAVVKGIFNDIPVAVDAAFQQIASLASGLWTQVEGIWNQGVTAVSGFFANIATAGAGVFGSVAAGAASLWQQISGFFQGGVAIVNAAWQQIVTGASTLWTQVVGFFNDGVAQISALPGQIVAALQQAWDSIASGAASLWANLTSGFSSMAQSIIAAVQSAISSLRELIGLEAQAASQSPQDAGAPPFAGGGHVRGSGTSTSDSILARLSNGEFVVRAQAVLALMRRYGTGVMHMINHGRLPSFKLGGFVDGLQDSLQSLLPPPLHFADGGLVPARAGNGNLRPINLQIGGESFGVQGDEDVVRRLSHAAIRKRVKSAGRKPNSYGGVA